MSYNQTSTESIDRAIIGSLSAHFSIKLLDVHAVKVTRHDFEKIV